jgi:hypothetical protein
MISRQCGCERSHVGMSATRTDDRYLRPFATLSADRTCFGRPHPTAIFGEFGAPSWYEWIAGSAPRSAQKPHW